MLNSKLLIILVINVTVLLVNIMLFIDKPQAPTELATAVVATQAPAMLPQLIFSPSRDSGISSVASFHFPLMPAFPPTEEHLKSQLELTQQALDKTNRQLKDLENSDEQLALLIKKHRALLRNQSELNDKLKNTTLKVHSQQQEIVRLQQQDEPPFLSQSDSEYVRDTIDLKPSLVKVKKMPAKVPIMEKEVLEDDVVAQLTDGEVDRFSGSIEFGFSYEQDNQISKAIKGRLILDYDEVDKYNINSDLDFEFEKEDAERTTEKYRWQLQADYNLDPVNLVYARSDLSRSQFSSYEQEDIFTIGYGRIFFNTEKHKFNIEFGPGYRFAVPNVGEDAVSIDEFIVRTRLNYERIVSENLQVKMDAVVELGRENSVYNIGFKAQNRIYQELYLIFDFTYKYTQNVPVDTVNKEVASGLSLLYAF